MCYNETADRAAMPCLVSGFFFSRDLGATGLGPPTAENISVFEFIENKMFLVYSELWTSISQNPSKIFWKNGTNRV